jgi:hypothetical protein
MTNITMNKRQKRGISTVLTTLIIVVASVVLGTAVTLFGTSLFQTGAQQQSMSVSNAHLWYNTDTTGGPGPTVEGAMVVRNTGDKLVAVDNIKVRNAIVPFSAWSASPTTVTSTEASAQFVYLGGTAIAFPPAVSANYDLDGGGTAIPAGGITMTVQQGPVSLEPGKTVIIYFTLPANSAITSADIGAAATVGVTAGQINTVQSVSVASVNVP